MTDTTSSVGATITHETIYPASGPTSSRPGDGGLERNGKVLKVKRLDDGDPDAIVVKRKGDIVFKGPKSMLPPGSRGSAGPGKLGQAMPALTPDDPRVESHDGRSLVTIDKISFSRPTSARLYRNKTSSKFAAGELGVVAGGGSAAVATGLIGAAAGSVVPIIGTAIGAVVGGLFGIIAGRAVSAIAYRHSREKVFDKALKELALQGVRFTADQQAKLQNVTQAQWDEALKKCEEFVGAMQRLPGNRYTHELKRLYMQGAILAASKGFMDKYVAGHDAYLKTIQKPQNRKNEDLANSIIHQQLDFIQKHGGNKVIADHRLWRRYDARKDPIKQQSQAWDRQVAHVKTKLGDEAGEIFHASRLQNIAKGDEPYEKDVIDGYCDECLTYKKALDDALREQEGRFDADVNAAIQKLAKRYYHGAVARDIAQDDLFDRHGNLDKRTRMELLERAHALQAAKVGRTKPVPDPDRLKRRAALPYDVAAMRDGFPPGTPLRRIAFAFFDRSTNIAADCAMLAGMSRGDLIAAIRVKGDADDVEIGRVADRLQALARLGLDLPDDIAPGTAQMLLRHEAAHRNVEDLLGNLDDSLDPGPKPPESAAGWAGFATDKPAAKPPQHAIEWAAKAAAMAKDLAKSMENDDRFAHIDRGQIDRMCFAMARRVPRVDDDGAEAQAIARLSANDFAGLKQVIAENAGVEDAMIALAEGCETVEEAIGCALLGVEAAELDGLPQAMGDSYQTWTDAGFSRPEIAAYRHVKLVEHGRRARDGAVRKMGPDSARLQSFKGSGLKASQVDAYFDMGIRSYRDAPARHRRDDIVLSVKFLGEGSFNEVESRRLKVKGGTEDRVFKPASFKNSRMQRDDEARCFKANLGATVVNRKLGFQAVADTEVSFGRDGIGLSMEHVRGHTLSQLKHGEAYLAVPDSAHYRELNARVADDRSKTGAISDETRRFAKQRFGFDHVRWKDGGLEACARWGDDVAKNPSFRRRATDLQIVDFLTDEKDRHNSNFMVGCRLADGGGIEVTSVKGIDNDGGFDSHPFMQNSVRTIPRVMTRTQVDAVKKLWKERGDDGGIDGALSGLVQSGITNGYTFTSKYNSPNAKLYGPDQTMHSSGKPLDDFDKRLEHMYKMIVDVEDNGALDPVDGQPLIKIIDDRANDAAWGGKDVTRAVMESDSVIRRAV